VSGNCRSAPEFTNLNCTRYNDDHHNHYDREDNIRECLGGDSSRGKIALRLARPLCQLRHFFVAQLSNSLVYPRIIDVGGLERILSRIRRQQMSDGFFVSLPSLCRPRHLLAQFVRRDDVLLLLLRLAFTGTPKPIPSVAHSITVTNLTPTLIVPPIRGPKPRGCIALAD